MSEVDVDEDDTSIFEFEMDLGTTTDVRPILRKAIAVEEAYPDKRRISWRDSQSKSTLESDYFSYPKEESEDDDDEEEGGGEEEEEEEEEETEEEAGPSASSSRKRIGKTKSKVPTDEEVLEVPNDCSPVKKAKRRYQRKKKVNKDSEDDEEAPLNINEDDSDNDNLLMIDEEGEDDAEVMGQKKAKKKPRKTKEQLRKEKEAEILKRDEILKQLDEKECLTTEDVEEEFKILCSLMGGNKKEKKVKKKKTITVEEIGRKLDAADPATVREKIRKSEEDAFLGWQREWNKGPQLKKTVHAKADDSVDDDELEVVDVKNGEMKELKNLKKETEDLGDMPDFDELVKEYEESLARGSMRMDDVDERVVEESDGEGKKEKEKEKVKEKVKDGKRKSTGGRGGTATKKKKEEDSEHREQTEEETMAEIGRKKADAEEKAARMKKQKNEDRERKILEVTKKKIEDETRREEKKRMKREEREIERKKKENEMYLMDRKPKSRAEAARRTKALLAMGKVDVESAPEEVEDEGETRTKKRKYRKRTTPVSFIRRIKDDDDDDEGGVGCGKYIDNPCDIEMEDVCTEHPLDSEDSDGEDDKDELLSVPFLWTSKEDEMQDGDIGPINFDSDEMMKRHLNDIEEFSNGITEEYREMTKKLDGMKLNLFADTTHRRFDPQVVHNIDFLSKVSTWPIDLLPQPGVNIPKYQFQIWNRPFLGLARIRPTHVKKDKLVSKGIDKLTGGATILSKQDIEKNLDDLIMSKLGKKKYTPLPSARNPFDIPEISTRMIVIGDVSEKREVKNYQTVSYVEKIHVKSIPCDNLNKKRKKTRKEVLTEIAMRPRKGPTGEEKENIYIDDDEVRDDGDEGYQYEWDEMGEIMENPMRDDRIGDDPFSINPYHGVEYIADDDMDVVDGGSIVDHSHYSHETEEETQLGEAFSFMAAHMDV